MAILSSMYRSSHINLGFCILPRKVTSDTCVISATSGLIWLKIWWTSILRWSKFLHFSAKAVYRKGAVDRKWLKAKHRNPNLKDEVSLLYVFEGGSSALSWLWSVEIYASEAGSEEREYLASKIALTLLGGRYSWPSKKLTRSHFRSKP